MSKSSDETSSTKPTNDRKWYCRCNSCGHRWEDNTAIAVMNADCCRTPNIHIWNYTHNWKLDWPGNYCLDCGYDDPNESEDALINCDCTGGCYRCSYTGCVPNPNLKVEPCPGP